MLELGRGRRRHPMPVIMRTPFNQAFIDEIKRRIPHVSRSYDPERHLWRCTWERRNDARDAMLAAWPEIQILGDPDDGDFVLSANGQMTTQETLL